MITSPDFLSELDALNEEAAELFALPAEQLIRQPAPSKWSALQCVEHLVLTNELYISAIDAAVRITKATKATGDGHIRPFSYSPFERFIVWATEPPSRLKLPAPRKTIASVPPRDVNMVREAYHNDHMKLQCCICEALVVDLRKTKVQSQLKGRLSVNAGITLGIILAHERRHLYQARRAAQ